MPLDVSRPLSGKSTVFGLSRFSCLVITEALLIGAISLQTGSIFFSDWRVGSGDTFMYPPNITQGFPSRLYGLIYVEGLRKMTWAELATNTCDRWGLDCRPRVGGCATLRCWTVCRRGCWVLGAGPAIWCS